MMIMMVMMINYHHYYDYDYRPRLCWLTLLSLLSGIIIVIIIFTTSTIIMNDHYHHCCYHYLLLSCWWWFMTWDFNHNSCIFFHSIPEINQFVCREVTVSTSLRKAWEFERTNSFSRSVGPWALLLNCYCKSVNIGHLMQTANVIVLPDLTLNIQYPVL